MKRVVRLLEAALVFALVAGLSSCTDSSGSVSMNGGHETSAEVAEIIGGFDSRGKAVDAIGTVGMKNRKGEYQFFCSATLIAPSTVLTAKHCAIVLDGPFAGMKLVNLVPIFFAVGPDSKTPTQIVEAIAADISPLNRGGFVGLGNDVAIYHLARPITDVTPIPVAQAPLTDADVNKAFASVGYGSQDNWEDITGDLSATRKAGRTTLRALRGKSFELMLGSYEAFRQQFVDIYGEDVVAEYEDMIKSWYDTTVIYEGYEVWTGAVDGDSQTCHGDSGGPLVGKVNGQRQVFGVVSGGWFSTQLACDYGTFYASLGEKTQALIAKSLEYKDPCAETSVEGQCEGDVAIRCTGKWEGDRRRTEMDCSMIDQVCARGAGGQVGCFNADALPSDGGTVVADGGTGGAVDGGAGNADGGMQAAPTLEEIRRSVVKASRQGFSLSAPRK